MEKAIIPVRAEDIPGEYPEGSVAWDCDFEKFRPIVEQMNELGAPVTLYDLMELIEGKLSGSIVSGTEDKFKRYTFIHQPQLKSA